MNFYISDLHLGQDELFYTLTPTERVSTEEIIEAINSRCNRHDTLYVVGDISGARHQLVLMVLRKTLHRGN